VTGLAATRRFWLRDGSSAPSLPPSAASDSIVITRTHHDYGGCWRADVARFGQFLLDIGNPAHPGDEYNLEGEAGSRGVAPLSAELTVWLPGSLGWQPGHGLG
jgi:hypothetical protein